jgi:hypothetical protein
LLSQVLAQSAKVEQAVQRLVVSARQASSVLVVFSVSQVFLVSRAVLMLAV